MAAHISRRDLHILFTQRAHDVSSGHAQCSNLFRIQPDTHGVIPGPKELDVAHPLDASQVIAHLQKGVVRKIEFAVAAVRRDHADGHGEVWRTLPDDHAIAANDLRQLGLGSLNPILDEHLGGIRVGSRLERHRNGHLAVRRRSGRNVEHVVHAVDLLFDRSGDGARDGFSVGPA